MESLDFLPIAQQYIQERVAEAHGLTMRFGVTPALVGATTQRKEKHGPRDNAGPCRRQGVHSRRQAHQNV